MLSNALARLSSFNRYSPLGLEVAEKRTNVKFFGPQFFVGRDGPNISTAGLSARPPPFG